MPSRIEILLHELATACPQPALTAKEWDILSLLAVQLHVEAGAPDRAALTQFFLSRGCSVHRARFFCRQLESFGTVLRMYDAEKIKDAQPR